MRPVKELWDEKRIGEPETPEEYVFSIIKHADRTASYGLRGAVDAASVVREVEKEWSQVKILAIEYYPHWSSADVKVIFKGLRRDLEVISRRWGTAIEYEVHKR